jgi:hypothetical protein
MNPKVHGTTNKIHKRINKIAAQETRGYRRRRTIGGPARSQRRRSTQSVNRGRWGRRGEGAPEQRMKERCGYGGGNPSCEPVWARTRPSPALHETLPAKHRAVPTRVGSRNWEDGGVQDEGVEMNETEQGTDARRASKHGQMHRVVLGWGSGWYEEGNQSPPI